MAGLTKIVEGKLCLSTAALCEVLGITKQALSVWEKNGCPKLLRGWWPLGDVLRWKGLVGNGGVKDPNKVEKMSLQQQKLHFETKYKQSQAEAIELKNEIARGEYLKRDEIVAELSRFFITMKRSIGSLSRKLVTEVGVFVDASTARRIEKQLDEILHDALWQLSVDGVYEAPKEKKTKS